MDAYAPLVDAALLAVFTLVITWVVRGQITSFRREVEPRLDRLENEVADLRKDVGALRRDFNSELTSLRRELSAELALLRRDFNQLVLALGPHAQPQTG